MRHAGGTACESTNIHVSKAFDILKGQLSCSFDSNAISTKCLWEISCSSSKVPLESNDIRIKGLRNTCVGRYYKCAQSRQIFFFPPFFFASPVLRVSSYLAVVEKVLEHKNKGKSVEIMHLKSKVLLVNFVFVIMAYRNIAWKYECSHFQSHKNRRVAASRWHLSKMAFSSKAFEMPV